jgi:hypothetical protein
MRVVLVQVVSDEDNAHLPRWWRKPWGVRRGVPEGKGNFQNDPHAGVGPNGDHRGGATNP